MRLGCHAQEQYSSTRSHPIYSTANRSEPALSLGPDLDGTVPLGFRPSMSHASQPNLPGIAQAAHSGSPRRHIQRHRSLHDLHDPPRSSPFSQAQPPSPARSGHPLDGVTLSGMQHISTQPQPLRGGSHGAGEYEALQPSPASDGEITFRQLTSADADLTQICGQLYALTTGEAVTPVVGEMPDGSTHFVLSMWCNERVDSSFPGDVRPRLGLQNLIGFVEYHGETHKSPISDVRIDKLVMSNQYAQLGFSKRLIRKLQHTPGIASISVWSLWQTEAFYMGLDFDSVFADTFGESIHDGLPSDSGAAPRRIEFEAGPLMRWLKDASPQPPPRSSGGSSPQQLCGRNSTLSLLGGSGAATRR
nr:hypothetical protein HK105_000008 [Polyrhizophydium stewartii]